MVAKEWENAVGARLVPAHNKKGTQGAHEGCPYVVMPDHFHALVRIPPVGARLVPARLVPAHSLGDIIGAFKSRVVHEYIAGVQAGRWPRFPGKIWHRNYYEMVVRSEEAERRIAEYIRMNPWRCVQEFGGGLRGIGNPALWNGEKLGVLCSRGDVGAGLVPAPNKKGIVGAGLVPALEEGTHEGCGKEGTHEGCGKEGTHEGCPYVYFGGWHSPKEKEMLDWLLKNGRRVIACPAWGIEDCAFAPGVRDALEGNRMLILEMRDTSGNLAAAEARNRFVIEHADKLFTPYIARGGMLERLLNEYKGKIS